MWVIYAYIYVVCMLSFVRLGTKEHAHIGLSKVTVIYICFIQVKFQKVEFKQFLNGIPLFLKCCICFKFILKGHEPEHEQQAKHLQKLYMNKGCIIEIKLSQIWHIAFLIYFSPKICQDMYWIYQWIVPKCQCLRLKQLSAHHHHPHHSTPTFSASSRIRRIISPPDICLIRFPVDYWTWLRVGIFNEFWSAVISFGRLPGWSPVFVHAQGEHGSLRDQLQKRAQACCFLMGGW